jgi:antitoxin (DNA-binding transcriptional repressor) of toxin-antitoxin stability system
MDAVQHGQAFTVTRDGHRIAELVPPRRRRRFVSRQELAAMSRNAPVLDTNIVILRRWADPAELPARSRWPKCRRGAENEFDAVPFDVEAARIYGRVKAVVVAVGRKPRRRMVN